MISEGLTPERDIWFAFGYDEEIGGKGARRASLNGGGVPYLVMAATDARKHESVADNQYRFTPYRIDENDLKRIHGTNERISVDNLNRCVAFFRFMLEG